MIVNGLQTQTETVTVVSQTKKASSCTEDERLQFFDVMNQGFLGVSWDDFNRDFEEKDEVMILNEGDLSGRVVGFGTLMNFVVPLITDEVRVIFSGDTYVLPEFRTSTGLGVQIGSYFLKVHGQYPDQQVYYTLISKGWRTYKIMPFFFRDFSPRPNKVTSPKEKEIMDGFGRIKYPHHYNPVTGLIEFDSNTQRLRPDTVDALPKKLDPYTEFFLRANPNYLKGNELVCLALISPDNFTPAFKRLIRSGSE